MGYVVSFTAGLQNPQGNVQTHSLQGHSPRHRKNLNRLTAIAAQCSTQESHTPDCCTLCLHHREVCLAHTLHVLAMHETRPEKPRSCPSPRGVWSVTDSCSWSPRPLWMCTQHSPGRSSGAACWTVSCRTEPLRSYLCPRLGVPLANKEVPALPVFCLSAGPPESDSGDLRQETFLPECCRAFLLNPPTSSDSLDLLQAELTLRPLRLAAALPHPFLCLQLFLRPPLSSLLLWVVVAWSSVFKDRNLGPETTLGPVRTLPQMLPEYGPHFPLGECVCVGGLLRSPGSTSSGFRTLGFSQPVTSFSSESELYNIKAHTPNKSEQLRLSRPPCWCAFPWPPGHCPSFGQGSIFWGLLQLSVRKILSKLPWSQELRRERNGDILLSLCRVPQTHQNIQRADPNTSWVLEQVNV